MSGRIIESIGKAVAFQSEPMTASELTTHVILVLTAFVVAYMILAALEFFVSRNYTKYAQRAQAQGDEEIGGILITIERASVLEGKKGSK